MTTFQVWREFVNLQFVPAVKSLADQARMVVAFDAVAFILGLGYVMGLRSSWSCALAACSRIWCSSP